MTVEEFTRICDRFTNKRLFVRDAPRRAGARPPRQPRQDQLRQRREAACAVVDYGVCNLDSVAARPRGVRGRPVRHRRSGRPRGRADRIVLPGVGAFADGDAQPARARAGPGAAPSRCWSNGVPFLGHLPGDAAAGRPGASRAARRRGSGWIPGERASGCGRTSRRRASRTWDGTRCIPRVRRPCCGGSTDGRGLLLRAQLPSGLRRPRRRAGDHAVLRRVRLRGAARRRLRACSSIPRRARRRGSRCCATS